jgi:hypothetical protein
LTRQRVPSTTLLIPHIHEGGDHGSSPVIGMTKIWCRASIVARNVRRPARLTHAAAIAGQGSLVVGCSVDEHQLRVVAVFFKLVRETMMAMDFPSGAI